MNEPVAHVKPAPGALRITADHHRNHTSQCGEDGVVEAIFAHLGVAEGTAVEFGAWDGVLYSNTNALIARGWSVVFIEGDHVRFQTLKQNFEQEPKVRAINAWVTPTGATSLDALLAGVGIDDIDFLSVDIDGDDYHVLASLTARPKVICVEFNPTIPPPIHFVGQLQRPEGSSIVAFHDLMSSRGYALVYATKLNAFFVRGDLADRFVKVSPAECFNYRSARFVIGFFDGRNLIVDALGKPAKAKNQWSRARAAIALNLPPLKMMVLCAVLLLALVIALAWWCAVRPE